MYFAGGQVAVFPGASEDPHLNLKSFVSDISWCNNINFDML
jgi:hypothetical protein